MGTKYVVGVDRQRGSFGKGRACDINEWREQAYEWFDTDGAFETEDEANDFQQMLSEMTEQEVIDYIADIWGLEFGKLIVVNGKNYAWTAYPVDKKNGDKAEITIYPLDDEYDTLPQEQVVYSPLTVDEIDEDFIKDIILKTLDKGIYL